MAEGTPMDEARSKIWMKDIHGLLVHNRPEGNLEGKHIFFNLWVMKSHYCFAHRTQSILCKGPCGGARIALRCAGSQAFHSDRCIGRQRRLYPGNPPGHGRFQWEAHNFCTQQPNKQGRVHRSTGLRKHQSEIHDDFKKRILEFYIPGQVHFRQWLTIPAGRVRGQDLQAWPGQQCIHLPWNRSWRDLHRNASHQRGRFPHFFTGKSDTKIGIKDSLF